MKKNKTYVLTVSEFFPKTHNKSGLPTGFINSISNQTKLHTIRGNYPLWKKRIEEVQAGNAILSVRYWTGKPYKSKQKEVFVFDKDSAIGIQKLIFNQSNYLYPYVDWESAKKYVDTEVTHYQISTNDGLSEVDFFEWFKKYDLSEPMAIIHFTPFRY